MKGHKGLHHRGHAKGGAIKHDTSVKHHPHHNKADGKHMKLGGSEQEVEGNKKVFHEAHEGTKGGGHIGGGAGPTMGRKRGGKAAHHGHHGHHKAHGGEVGADKHPFSSAHHSEKHGGSVHHHALHHAHHGK
jgi:hypothetical protein